MSEKVENSFVIAVFDGPETADFVYNQLLDMQNAVMADIKMVSTVTRNARGKLKVHHKQGLTTWRGTAGGVAIGFLLGGPLLGGAIGALVGSRGGGEQRKARQFLDDKMTADQSALIAMLRDADWTAVRDLFVRFEAQIMQLELSPEAEAELQQAAGDAAVATAVRDEIEIETDIP